MDATCLQHMRQKMSQGLTWSSRTYKHHVNTLGQGTGALETVQINDRSYDLTAMLSTIRLIAEILYRVLPLISTKLTISNFRLRQSLGHRRVIVYALQHALGSM